MKTLKRSEAISIHLTTGDDSPENGQSATDLTYCTLDQWPTGEKLLLCIIVTDSPTGSHAVAAVSGIRQYIVYTVC